MSEDVKKQGRKLKYAELEELNEQPAVVTEVAPKAKLQPAFTQMAVGIGQNENGKWCVFKWEFDSMTKQIEFKEVLEHPSRQGAVNKFKMIAGKFLA